jgi:polysaccharide biosynthesis transport protein
MPGAVRESTLELAGALWRRRKWQGVIVFAAAFSAAISLVAGLPDLYRATVTILVDQAQVPESFVRSTVTGDLEPRLQALNHEILSRARLQDLIGRFDLYPELRRRAPPEAVIDRMRKDIHFERKEVGQQWGRAVTIGFTVSYQGWDPRTVAEVTNTLASFYVAENHRTRERQAVGTTALLKEQLEEIRKKMEARLRAANDAEARRHEPEKIPVRPRSRDPAVDRLAQLKRELAELRTRYSDRYPDVIRARDEIATLESRLADRPPAASDELPEQAQDRGDARDRARDREKPTADSLSIEELHASLLKRYEEAQLAETLEREKGEQFRILDPAIPPAYPVAPARLQLMAMSMMLSLLLAGLAMALAEGLDTSFHRMDDLRAFAELPILAKIPLILTSADAWRRRLRVGAVAVLVLAGLVLVARGSYQLGQGGEQLVWMFAQRRA